MADPYRKPQIGDAPKRSARFEAELVDVVRWVKGQMAYTGARTGAARGDAGIIDVRNDSGDDVAQFGILGIDDAVFTPSAALATFKTSPLYSGALPTIADHDGRFAVAIEPIAADAVGKARIAGVVPLQVVVTTGLEWYGCADVTDEDTETLTLLPAGAANVLWIESGTGTKWALVRLGNPPGCIKARIVLDAELAAGSSAAASVWDGDPIADTGNNLTVWDGNANWKMLQDGGTFPAGTHGVACWYPGTRAWNLDNASCTST